MENKYTITINKTSLAVFITIQVMILSFLFLISPVGAEATSWLNSGNNMYSNVSANVGIGNTSPTAKLDVIGNVRSKGTSNGAANYITQSSNGSYQYSLATSDANELYIGRMNGGGGTESDLVFSSGVYSKAVSNGASTFVNKSNDGTTNFGQAIANGPSSGTGTYYFGITAGPGNGISKTYIKVDNNTGTMCLGNC
jgi:hypothetical protein